MQYAVNYIYDDGDNASYLHPSYQSALKEKEDSIEDLIDNYLEMGYNVELVYDEEVDTLITYFSEVESKQQVRIVLSKIYV